MQADAADVSAGPCGWAWSGGRFVSVPLADDAAVDQAFVLASGSMDRHLVYVAMTRHRDGAPCMAIARNSPISAA